MQAETKARLVREGKWEDFVRIREKLKSEGETPGVASTKAQMVVDSTAKSGDPYKRLILAAPEGNCSEREAAQFVFEYAACEPAEIPDSAVPSKGAVGLLKWLKSSPANCTAFYATIWPKLMPTKSQLDAEARYSDDGVRSLELLSQLESVLDGEEKMFDVPEDSDPQELRQEPVEVQGLHTDSESPEEVRYNAGTMDGDV
jgi:hypothetical protein